MYPKEIEALAEKLLKEDVKTLLIALLIQQQGKETSFWLDRVKMAMFLAKKKGDSK